MENKDLWAPCIHGDTVQAAKELLQSSPPLENMLFALADEGEVCINADQWCRVTVSMQAVRYAVQSDTIDLAVAQIWRSAIEDKALDPTQYTEEFVAPRTTLEPYQFD